MICFSSFSFFFPGSKLELLTISWEKAARGDIFGLFDMNVGFFFVGFESNKYFITVIGRALDWSLSLDEYFFLDFFVCL